MASGKFNPNDYHSKKGHTHKKSIECPILFFDVVGFSKDINNERAKKIVTAMQSVMWDLLDPEEGGDTEYYWAEREIKKGRKNNLVLIPTGDGYGIATDTTLGDKKILSMARELYRALVDQKIAIRMGIAKGRNVITIDLNENVNIFGYGIVLATRVCEVAAPGQILVHSKFAESLLEERKIPDLKKIKSPLKTKHGLKITCYNYFRKTAKGAFGKKV